LYLVSSTLGYAYVLAGRVPDALPWLEQNISTEGVEIMRGRVHVWLGEAYLRPGRCDEALAVAVRGLDLCRAIELYHTLDMSFWLLQAQTALAQVG
jgi:hypothetical protein